MNSGHVVLQAAVGDKGLGTFIDQAPEEQGERLLNTRARRNIQGSSFNPVLVRLLPAVVEFMSGELVASAEAPVAVLTGERFLR